MPSRPQPARFEHYRAYLTAMIDHLRAVEPRFSYRWFARRAGFSSPNFLKLVADGRRKMSAESIDPFARGLGLDSLEQRAFEALVRVELAETDAERDRWRAILETARAHPTVRSLGDEAATLLADWWGPFVRELVALHGFREDPAWISARLYRRISPAQARTALKSLEESGLLARDADGRLIQSDPHVTASRVGRPGQAQKAFPRAAARMAIKAIDAVTDGERFGGGMLAAIDPRQFDGLRRTIDEELATLLPEIGESRADSARVYLIMVWASPFTWPIEGEPAPASDDPDDAPAAPPEQAPAAPPVHQRPDPAAFDGYRDYLQAMIEHLRAVEPAFSYRWFARRAGFSSPNFLKLVADGDRAMPAGSIAAFADGFGLDADEHRRFEALVQTSIAATGRERWQWFERLRAARAELPVSDFVSDAIDILSAWWPPVIGAMVQLPQFRPDPEWIVKQMRRPLETAAADRALAQLRRLGMVERGPDGRMRLTNRRLTLSPEVQRSVRERLERIMLEHHALAVEKVSPDRRHSRGLAMRLDPARFAKVRARLSTMQRAMFDRLDTPTADPASVYHISTVAAPLTQAIADAPKTA